MIRTWRGSQFTRHPAHKDANLADPEHDHIIKRLHQMIGDESVAIEVLSTFRWSINDQVAKTWQRGRVLCVGDAVHRHPPINGLGSNTCISDAFNLAWKLAYVLRGTAGARLLDTLTMERKPVGDAIVRRANDGMLVHRQLWSLLGLTPEERKRAVELLQDPTAEGRAARKEFQFALAKTDLEFQALGIQMNQLYLGSPATFICAEDVPPDHPNLDMLKEAAISTFPGYHLPHVWLAASGQSSRVSSLDLCGHGRFTLLTGVGGECWKRAMSELIRSGVDLPMAAFSIGFRCDYMDLYGEWAHCRGVEEDGVVLVRPDQFVAWRYHSCSEGRASALLREALSHVLSIESLSDNGS